MKKLIRFSWFYLIGITAYPQTTTQKLDTLLSAYAQQYEFNGAALVAQNGNILLQKGYGWKNVQQKAKNDENTIFQVGSITKQFTSAIILQLQQEKKLSVQDKLSKYFPDFANGDKITIEHLLTHTSGIYNYTNDQQFMKDDAVKPATKEKMLSLFKDKPLDFEPGTKWSYSNSGYMLLGYIIEKVTRKSYFAAVRERIFNPLHMDHSGFDFTNLTSPDKATGYFALTATSNIPAGIVDSTASYAAGAIYTTVGDLYKWDRALYSDKIITKSSQQQAFTPYKGHYGYGWNIDSLDGKRRISHGGGIFGFTSFISRFPDDNICIIVFDNHGTPTDKEVAGITSILNNKPYELPKAKIEVKVDTAVLRQYTGQYQLAPEFIITITLEDGHLMGQPTGQGKVELFAEKENYFFLKVVDAQVEFIKSADGKIEKLILHQNGRDVPGPKIK